MDWRYLDLRREQNLLLFKVQTLLEYAMREYWMQQNFIEIHSPKITGSPSESGAELFEVQYFERKAYLAQSPQFYKQMAMAAGFEKVFEIGPVFRADPSFTSRHMTEFTGLDVEISWIESHEDVMAFTERWLQYAWKRIKDTYGAEIERVFGVDIKVPEVPFPRMPMSQAYAILKDMNYKLPPERKGDLDPGGERAIADYAKKEYGSDFLFVTDWPIAVRPFYHMRYADKPELTRSFDLIASGLELPPARSVNTVWMCSKHRLEKGLGLDNIQYYWISSASALPHTAALNGPLRLLMVLLNLPNIRESVYLFRGPNRVQP
jgi:aspartyl-tRNA synthetase